MVKPNLKKAAWLKRVEASRDAATRLKESVLADNYAKLYKQYEPKLASEDQHEAWLAREILFAQYTQNVPRMKRAKNAELLSVEWLPNQRIFAQWPFPVQLSHPEWEVAFHHTNEIYVMYENKRYLFDRRVFSEIQPGDSYSSPVFEDLVWGFNVRYYDYIQWRVNYHANTTTYADNPSYTGDIAND